MKSERPLKRSTLTGLVVSVLLCLCLSDTAFPADGSISEKDLLEPDWKSWLTYSGDYSGRRHSALDQIHPGNIHKLAARWIFPVPGANRLVGTPIVAHGLMYVTSRNAVFALDARSGREVWHFSRPMLVDVIGDARAGINRGVAVFGNKVFFETHDAHLLALHAKNGSLLWETEIGDHREGYGGTMAPLIVKNKVIAGISGGDEGVRGLLTSRRRPESASGILDDSRSRRTRLGNLERQRHHAWLWGDLADRDVRSRAEYALLDNWQPVS
jgi:glucose dehydrogenase